MKTLKQFIKEVKEKQKDEKPLTIKQWDKLLLDVKKASKKSFVKVEKLVNLTFSQNKIVGFQLLLKDDPKEKGDVSINVKLKDVNGIKMWTTTDPKTRKVSAFEGGLKHLFKSFSITITI